MAWELVKITHTDDHMCILYTTSVILPSQPAVILTKFPVMGRCGTGANPSCTIPGSSPV